MKLMVPGPAETWPEDLGELARPLLPHYGKEFLEAWHAVRAHLQAVFGTKAEVLMLPGAGTAGTEMCCCGFRGHKVLVVLGGTFAERIAEILEAHRAEVIALPVAERGCADPAAVAEALRRNPGVRAVFMVHSETSTGTLHPVPQVARVVKAAGALFAVDAVSSAGGLDFRMDEWGVDIAWSASQKALACPPGLAMVAINDRAFAFLKENEAHIGSWYLNPLVWKWHADNWAWHPYPTSLPTPVFVAMRKALDRLVGAGLAKHFRQQQWAAAAIRDGCRKVGFELYPRDEAFASPCITALIPPKGMDEEAFRNSVLADHGIMIAGGFGRLRGQVVRIGHMGPGTTEGHVNATLDAVRSAARKHGAGA